MGKRRLHKLAPNKRSSRPRNVIFVDTETYSHAPINGFSLHTLRMGRACFQRRWGKDFYHTPKWLEFTDTSTFWDFVEDQNQSNNKVYIVAHNMEYDMGILETHRTAKQRGWVESFRYIKDQVCIVCYKTKKGPICLLSTTNYFKHSLKELGEAVGMEKKEVDFHEVDDDTLSEYCYRDVEILMAIWYKWLDFLDDHDLGDFKLTISGQAMAAFTHRFMTTDIWIHAHDKISELERASYRGGRCEDFRHGKIPEGMRYYLDINGFYGHIQETGLFPCDFKCHLTDVDPNLLRKMLKRYCLVARVKIETEEPAFPIRLNGLNVYPVGCFETVLTTPELEYAFKKCRILEVLEVAVYKRAPLFKDYASYFSLLKQHFDESGDQIGRKIAKSFNNHLYGKFGQKAYAKPNPKPRNRVSPSGVMKSIVIRLVMFLRDKTRAMSDVYVVTPKENYNPRTIPGKRVVVRTEKWSPRELFGYKPKTESYVFLGHKDVDKGIFNSAIAFTSDYSTSQAIGESANSFPAIAAHVTAYGRIYLWEMISQAGRNNVFYTDTDGMFVNEEGYKNCLHLIDKHKSGYLSVKKQGTSLTVLRRKGYELDGKRTVAGIRHNAKEIAPWEFRQDQFLRTSGATRQGDPDMRGVKKVTRKVHQTVKGGILCENGVVEPFRVNLVDGELVVENQKPS